jgi:REP element-mobilizing transposase RayT
MSSSYGHRRSIRLRGYDYTRVGAYFITILTHLRERSLCAISQSAEGDACVKLTLAGEIAQTCWDSIPEHFPHVSLGAFQIMPDHLHGIVVIDRPPPPLVKEVVRIGLHPDGRIMPTGRVPGSVGAIVASYKSAVTKQVNESRRTLGAKVWHGNYYERIIRDDGEHERIARYIAENPMKWLAGEW